MKPRRGKECLPRSFRTLPTGRKIAKSNLSRIWKKEAKHQKIAKRRKLRKKTMGMCMKTILTKSYTATTTRS